MRKALSAVALTAVATLLMPVPAAFAEGEGVPGTCDGVDEISSTVENPMWVKKDRNDNLWVCVKVRLDREGQQAGYRIYDDNL